MALVTDRQKVAHLLRRAGFGASLQELEHFTSLGLAATREQLLNYEQVDEGFNIDPWSLRPERKDEAGQARGPRLPAPLVASWWAARMLLTKRPLQEKMTLFWHDHFGCSAEKVKGGALNLQHNELLREMALGRFDELLLAVAQDPTMMRFLDTGENRKSQPNENFARELLELYTLGIGNYSEQDVQEAARAFTGWSIERPDPLEHAFDDMPKPGFRFRAGQHDNGSKTILGHSGNFGGEDVIRILCEQPQCPRYIAAKLWAFFAYEQPEPALVERLAGVLRDSGLSIRALLHYIFSAPEFYSERAEFALYKSPADFVIGSLRASSIAALLGASVPAEPELEGEDPIGRDEPRRALGLMRTVMQAMKNEGLALLFPPSVAGWEGGSAWVNSATMVERIKLADIYSHQGLQTRNPKAAKGKGKDKGKKQLQDGSGSTQSGVVGRTILGQQKQRTRSIPPEALLGTREYASVDEMVAQIILALDARLPAEKSTLIAQSVVARLDSPATDRKTRQQVVYETARLVFASPEYQMM